MEIDSPRSLLALDEQVAERADRGEAVGGRAGRRGAAALGRRRRTCEREEQGEPGQSARSPPAVAAAEVRALRSSRVTTEWIQGTPQVQY